MNEAHARLSPSNHRWPNCAGSVREEAVYEDIPGAAAVDGTGSHLLLELCLNNNVRASVYEGEIIGANHRDNPLGWQVQQDRIERVQQCLDYVKNRLKVLKERFPGSNVIVEAESKAYPGDVFGREDWWGTCDITITVMNTHQKCLFLEAIDYKDGRYYVHHENNTQLISYAFGKAAEFMSKRFELQIATECQMTIVQPKISPPVRSQTVTPEELLQLARGLADAAEKTDPEDAPLTPDNRGGKGWCRWCKHRENCTALNERDLKELKTMTSDDKTVATGQVNFFDLLAQFINNPEQMSADKLTLIADMKAGITSVFDKVEQEIERRITEGDNVPGWAMKPGRASKVWAESDEKVAKKLKAQRLRKDQIYPSKMITPAQYLNLDCVKEVQKERVRKELIVEEAGDDKLTRVAEPRQKAIDVTEMFPTEEQVAQIDFTAPPKKAPSFI